MSRIGRSALGAVLACALAACGGKATGPKPPLSEGGPPAAPAAIEDLKGQVASIDVVGLAADRAAAVRSALRSAVGATFDRTTIASDVRAIWALGSIADVRVEARPAEGGVALRYAVREQPRIASIDVQGSKTAPAAQWVAQMPVKAGDFFDPVRLGVVSRNILEQLRQAGFHTAKVSWAKKDTKAGGADVIFTVEEGRLVSLAEIELRGNKAVPRKQLLALLAENGGAAIGARYWRDALQRGLDRLSAHYFDLGYVNVGVGPVEEKLSADGGQMTLVIPIAEGGQYRLGDLSFEGALAAPKAEYASRFGMKRGQVFSRRKVAEGMERLRELQRTKGQANANIIPVTEVDEAKKRIKVTIQVIAAQGGQVPPKPQAQTPPAPAAPQASTPPAPAPATPPASAPSRP